MTLVHLGETNSGSNSFMALASLDQVAMDALPEAVYLCAADGRVVRFNQKAVELWGRTPKAGDPKERFCGSFRLYRTDGTLLPHDQCPMAAALQTGKSFRNQGVVVEQPNGRRLTVLANIAVLKDREGRVNGAINCFRDITDLKQAEDRQSGRLTGVNMLLDITERKRADAQAQRLASIVEWCDDAIVAKDLNGTIEFWNRGAQDLFGYTADEVIGRPITILIPSERHQEERDILARIRSGERVDRYDTVRRRKDGSSVEVSLTVSPIKDPAGRVIGASKIARDITARKQLERNAEFLARELDHRIRNLMATVQAVTRMTRAKTPEEYVETLTGRLTALARIHTLLAEGRWGGVEIRRLMREMFAPYRIGDTECIRISGPNLVLRPEAVQPLVLTLHELATNAAKYGALSSPDGRVMVDWSEKSSQLSIGWREVGGPPVHAPTRRGFGSGVIRELIRTQLNGQVALRWHAAGVRCHIDIPMENACGAAWQSAVGDAAVQGAPEGGLGQGG